MGCGLRKKSKDFFAVDAFFLEKSLLPVYKHCMVWPILECGAYKKQTNLSYNKNTFPCDVSVYPG